MRYAHTHTCGHGRQPRPARPAGALLAGRSSALFLDAPAGPWPRGLRATRAVPRRPCPRATHLIVPSLELMRRCGLHWMRYPHRLCPHQRPLTPTLTHPPSTHHRSPSVPPGTPRGRVGPLVPPARHQPPVEQLLRQHQNLLRILLIIVSRASPPSGSPPSRRAARRSPSSPSSPSPRASATRLALVLPSLI